MGKAFTLPLLNFSKLTAYSATMSDGNPPNCFLAMPLATELWRCLHEYNYVCKCYFACTAFNLCSLKSVIVGMMDTFLLWNLILENPMETMEQNIFRTFVFIRSTHPGLTCAVVECSQLPTLAVQTLLLRVVPGSGTGGFWHPITASTTRTMIKEKNSLTSLRL